MQAPRAAGSRAESDSDPRRRAPLPTYPTDTAHASLESSQETVTTKPRKRYTMTKVRESWSNVEHQRFLEAIKLFNRDWKKIEEYIGTKSVKQVRSHAQKYFLKVQKAGGADFIPPARPKRKSGTVSRSDGDESPEPAPVRAARAQSASSAPPSQHSHSSFVLSNPSMFSHWISTNGLVPPPQGLLAPPPHPQQSQNPIATLFAIPLDDISRLRRTQEQLLQAQAYLTAALNAAAPSSISPGQSPNLTQVYAFLGSLFDPVSENHLEALNRMSLADRESAQTMMNHLAVQLHNSIATMERAETVGTGANGVGSLAAPLSVHRPDRPKSSDDSHGSQEVLRPPQERRPSLTMLLFAPRSPRLRDTDGLSEQQQQQQHASALLDVLPRSDPFLFPGAGDYGAK